MAHTTTDSNYTTITVLCSKCGQETKVDTTTSFSIGVTKWYNYHCQHCGHSGIVETKPVQNQSVDLMDYSSLKRIADALEGIRDILKLTH